MYKTVRKGENSLQYTILPQTEEVMCNNGVKGLVREYNLALYWRGPTVKRRKSVVAVSTLMIVLLLFAIMAITDFCLQKYLIGKASQLRVNAIASSIDVSAQDSVKSKKKELRVSDAPTAEIAGLNIPKVADSPLVENNERVKTSWALSGVWRITVPPIVENQNDLSIPDGLFNRLRTKNRELATDAMIRPTVTVDSTTASTPTTVTTMTTPTTHVNVVVSTIPELKTTMQDVLISTKYNAIQPRPVPTANKIETTNQYYPLGKDLKGLKDSILDIDDDEEFKDSEVDTMPPMSKIPSKEMLAKVSEYYEREMSESVRKEEIHKMWPFGSSSMTVFQWPDYSLEDSMMVPLLAGTAALLTLALGLTAAVARRRRRVVKTISQIEMNEDAPENDNTNLLTVQE